VRATARWTAQTVEQPEQPGTGEDQRGADADQRSDLLELCAGLMPGDHAEHHEREPRRRRQVGEGAEQHVDAAHGHEAVHARDAQVLQVTLAPAVVARDVLVQRRGQLFVAAALEIVRDAHLPARAAEQGCLDEVVAEHVTAEGRLAVELGQRAAIEKRADANGSVVAVKVCVSS
jgi:hypothetical protein